jgi:hypothetical protein
MEIFFHPRATQNLTARRQIAKKNTATGAETSRWARNIYLR